MNADEQDSPTVAAPDALPKHDDPEYLLKGVQAFGLGVALFVASIAVAHAALKVIESPLGTFPFKLVLFCLLFLISLPISVFGCLAVFLGRSMTGFWESKWPIKIIEMGINALWIVFVFVLVGSIN